MNPSTKSQDYRLPKLKNQKLFEEAFTHRSYLNEAKQKVSSNERLEFLGDSILSFVVSNYLFENFTNFDEGTLTNIRSLMVNTKSLSNLASELEMGKLLKLSKGEEESMGRENETLLENSFEAFVGALFLDQGIEAVKDFLNKILLSKTQELIKKKTFKDPKSILQEMIQAKKRSSPTYKVIEEQGPAHLKTFKVGVYINGTLAGVGIGKSKQIAESLAAKNALERKDNK